MRHAGYTLKLPDGREIQLKLDFAAMEAAEAEGLNLLADGLTKTTGVAAFLWAVSRDSAPDMGKDDWLALLLNAAAAGACGEAVGALFARFSAPNDEAEPAGEPPAGNG